jgi:hypothetical protein
MLRRKYIKKKIRKSLSDISIELQPKQKVVHGMKTHLTISLAGEK